MNAFGIGLYLIGLLLCFLMWRKTAGIPLEELFRRSSANHHADLKVFERFPLGSGWREYRRHREEVSRQGGSH